MFNLHKKGSHFIAVVMTVFVMLFYTPHSDAWMAIGTFMQQGLRLLAGGAGGYGARNGLGTGARFSSPNNVACDSSGNIYVADTSNNVIRKITPAGIVTTFAGTMTVSGSTDGTGTGAQFNGPTALGFDSSNMLYVADTNNDTIRMITPAGVVTTLAGSAGLTGTTDQTGSLARFNHPGGIAADQLGNLYISDTANHTIRKLVISTGVVTTLAGTAGTSGTTDATGTSAKFSSPASLVVAGTSPYNIYLADYGNSSIRQITTAGVVTTFAGTSGSPGGATGTGTAARFYQPKGITWNSANGNFYVADAGNELVWQITSGAVVTVFAGTMLTFGDVDATGTSAKFYAPFGITVDSSSNLYVSELGNSIIRKVTSTAAVTTFAGMYPNSGTTDGTGVAARFNITGNQAGIAFDGLGNTFVSDNGNYTVRQVTAGGVVTTPIGLAGTSGNAAGSGTTARFNNANQMSTDFANSVIYFADTASNKIRYISYSPLPLLAGSLAGSGAVGSTNAIGNLAKFSAPRGAAYDVPTGYIYVADTGNHLIRQVTASGSATTLAGSVGSSGSTNGTGTAAKFYSPYALVSDGLGNLYVADTYNHLIRKIVISTGVVTTLAGTAGVAGSTDGTGTAAKFNLPTGIAIDTNTGIIFVNDSVDGTIRRITPAGVVTTFIGKAGLLGLQQGHNSVAGLNTVGSIAIYNGNLYILTENSLLVTPEW